MNESIQEHPATSNETQENVEQILRNLVDIVHVASPFLGSYDIECLNNLKERLHECAIQKPNEKITIVIMHISSLVSAAQAHDENLDDAGKKAILEHTQNLLDSINECSGTL